MRCNECGHAVALHDHSGCLLCQAHSGDAFWCSRTDALVRARSSIPPLRVWRVRRRWKLARWAWACRACGASSHGIEDQRWPYIVGWREALSNALDHMYYAHGCPSMLAAGEPCDDYCADCGGRMWIK